MSRKVELLESELSSAKDRIEQLRLTKIQAFITPVNHILESNNNWGMI